MGIKMIARRINIDSNRRTNAALLHCIENAITQPSVRLSTPGMACFDKNLRTLQHKNLDTRYGKQILTVEAAWNVCMVCAEFEHSQDVRKPR